MKQSDSRAGSIDIETSKTQPTDRRRQCPHALQSAASRGMIYDPQTAQSLKLDWPVRLILAPSLTTSSTTHQRRQAPWLVRSHSLKPGQGYLQAYRVSAWPHIADLQGVKRLTTWRRLLFFSFSSQTRLHNTRAQRATTFPFLLLCVLLRPTAGRAARPPPSKWLEMASLARLGKTPLA